MKEQSQTRGARWRRVNPSAAKNWVAANPEKMKEYQKKHRDKNKPKNAARHKDYHAANKDTINQRRRVNYLLQKYGLTLEKFQELLDSQGGVCAACGGPPTTKGTFAVDHCHETDKVRGLLCGHCNCLIGYAKEEIQRLHGCIRYLRRVK